jgi:hypothetical protein
MIRLRVEGEVESPREFGFRELAGLPHQVHDIGAVIPGREGGGVRLQSLLSAVTIKAPVTHVTLASTDGAFSASVPLAAVRDGIVAYRFGTQPLPADKGGPVRFFIPNVEQCAIGGIDACANVKRLGFIRLTVGPDADNRPTNPKGTRESAR